MHYYEVLPAHLSYHGSKALTYSSEKPIAIGSLVQISIRNRPVLGIVRNESVKPDFTVKPVVSILTNKPIPPESLQLIPWLHAYYPSPLGAVVRLFVPPTLAEKRKSPDSRISNDEISEGVFDASLLRTPVDLPPLTPSQTQALQTIQGPGSFLLHGITGSGKSRVYLELTKRAAAVGTSAIILTPEIGLTAQLAAHFTNTFGRNVYVLHSQQTVAERRDSWNAVANATGPVVVVGPRSALFTPVHNVGLIILDEAHDGAYKNESAPHYQSSRVAATLAHLHGASFVSGSATPSIEDYYVAEQKSRPIVQMNTLAKTSDTTVETVLVDLKDKAEFTTSRIISNTLLQYMTEALGRGEQSLLFLNRRGTANVVLCNQCGWQTLCPNCDLTLTYHGDEHILRCHVCGHSERLPSNCPVCSNTELLFKSIGTKAVLAEVQKRFPSAQVQRFDTDLKKSERIEQNMYSISEGSADILIGTQIIGKGLDLPKLSVVGIINADSSLLIPDYTAAERTYQLVSQVAGRVGRGHRAGTVIAQTYEPNNGILQQALHRNWATFYPAELAERKQYLFPPFTYLLKLRCLRASSASAEKTASSLASHLIRQYPGLIIEGPSPSFHPRERGKYSWQILVKSPRRPILTRIITDLPSGWLYDIDPINLL